MKMIPPSSLSAPPHPLLLMVVQPLMKLIKPITTILSIFVISSSPATALTSLHWMSRLGSASAFSISSKYVFVGHYPRRALAVPHFRSNKSSLSASAAPCRARRGGSPSLLVAADSSTSTTRQYTHQNNNLHSRSTKVSPVIAMQMLRGGGGGGKSSSSSRNSITNASTRKFDTWSFDKPCEDMEWTQPSSDRITFSNILSDSTEDGNGILNAAITESDLIIIGIMPPSSSSSSSALSNGDNDEEDGDDTEELLPPIELAGIAKHLNDLNVNGLLSQVANENAASFKNGAVLGCTTPVIRVASDGENLQKYVLLGLGKASNSAENSTDNNNSSKNDDPLIGFGMKIGSTMAAQCMKDPTIKKCLLILPSATTTTLMANVASSSSTTLRSGCSNKELVISDLVSSFYTTLYSDKRFKTKKQDLKLSAEKLQSIKLYMENEIDENDSSINSTNKAIETGIAIAKGIYMTKDIVNAPHNILNSISLANTAKKIASECSNKGRLKCTVLGKKECEQRGMGAFLGVARGSETDPQLIHLTYTPPPLSAGKNAVNKKVALVGKGLLFDTGGYNIKTAMMELMKFDCGGSAAVLGAARSLGELAPEGVEAHFIVAACENMINQKAVVPSDILTASNGKTIEVLNTDAEGRLTLADALVYADEEVGCEKIIELSTLTGACMISLGKKVAGVWTSSDGLAKELEHASKITADKTWRMPLETDYSEQLKSSFADLKNIGAKYGGAITAALFLQNFVRTKKVPFAHIDIAGPVWDDKVGATGFGARLVTEWVMRQGDHDTSITA